MDERKKRGRSNFLSFIGDSMTRYFYNTITAETNVSFEILPKRMQKGRVVKETEFVRLDFVAGGLLNNSEALITYIQKPTVTFFQFGRWYLHELWWPEPDSNFSVRLQQLENDLDEWVILTSEYLKHFPKSKVIQKYLVFVLLTQNLLQCSPGNLGNTRSHWRLCSDQNFAGS
jgi:hypothetical protein